MAKISLLLPKPGINAIACQQFIMVSQFGNLALGYYADTMAMPHSREPMGNGDNRPIGNNARHVLNFGL